MQLVINADLLDTNAAGTRIYLESILIELSKTSWQKKILCIHQKTNPFFRKHGINELVIPDKDNIPGYSTYRLFYKIPQVIRKLKPQIVWEPSHFGPFRVPKNCKRITTIHDLSPVLHPEFHTFMGSFQQKVLFPSIFKKASAIITPSHFTKQELTQNYKDLSPSAIHPIPLAPQPGINHSSNTSFLKKINLTDPYILQVNTLEPRKNHKSLLEAFTEVKKLRPALKLVLVGNWGWRSESLRKQLASHPNKTDIILLHNLTPPELSQIYCHCLLSVSTSVYEGFGLPILESMRTKALCLASDIPSHRELGRKTIVYFNPQNINNLTTKINEMLSQPNEERAQKAYQKSLQYSWFKHTQKLIDLFEELVYNGAK